MKKTPERNELRQAIGRCKSYLWFTAIFSACVNILYLAPTLYLIQVYDRVLVSTSIPTLLFLTAVTVLALATLAGLDFVRSVVLTKMGMRLDRMLSARIYQALMDHAISGQGQARGQVIRDFDTVRQFLTTNTIHAIFDVPWTPVYIFVAFLLHPLLGAVSLFFVFVLLTLAVLNEWVTRKELAEANAAALKNYGFTEASLRNAEAVQALGMFGSLLKRWYTDRIDLMNSQASASLKGATITSTIRFLRMAMQSLILGLAAYLVIERSLTPGSIFAATVLLGRALQPIEQAVAMWRPTVQAAQSYRRIVELLTRNPPRETSFELPAPQGALAVEKLFYRVPGRDEPVLTNVSFAVAAGESIAVIGPSAAGKSTLARLLVGVLPPTSGVVRLDGADVYRWPREQFGKYVGYVPQDVELFAGTVAENISRFRDTPHEMVVEAARLAGVHELILRLPSGYETQLGEFGNVLSGGQRQRIALARAVFGLPKFLVLDEPNSNLDSTGESVLVDCLAQLKSRGTTTILISHRLNAIASVDKILILNNGHVEAFGPRAEVLARITRPAMVKPAAGVPNPALSTG